VCYGRGGTEPTVTDANLLLGYLNPDALVGGELRLDHGAAERALAGLAARLGLSLTDAAYGIHLVANAAMMRALQAVTSERGRDPSQFALLAMGGNGGVHAANLAASLHVGRIVVPPVAGLFSALGMLFADVEHQFIGAFFRRLDGVRAQAVNDAIAMHVEQALRLLAAEGYGEPDRHALAVHADVKYAGQTAPLSLQLPSLPVTEEMLAALPERYGALHEQTYGYRSDGEPLQIVALKVIGRGLSETSRVPQRVAHARVRGASTGARRAYFGRVLGWQTARLAAREAAAAGPMAGPVIVEEYDTTTVVPPGWTARTDDWNNLLIERAQ
jgi:N-methylhydantoinase A